ncbi:phosphatase PAP2 family protein, partial [Stenotrophomonas maltophilia]|nr:phosphatase PAP2 family protein [Stenotrophomonas maltophilia]
LAATGIAIGLASASLAWLPLPV